MRNAPVLARKRSSSLTAIPIFENCLRSFSKTQATTRLEAGRRLEALTEARATRPDLILMDLFMPNVSGDEAIVWLKADPLTRNVPVIVTTAFPTDRMSIVLSRSGAAEVLYKPFHLKSLDAMLQRHLSVNREPSQPDPLGPSRPSILSFRHRDRFLRPTKRPGA